VAYDSELDARVAGALEPYRAVRRLMFGGTGYMLNGHLAAGVHKDRLVLRLSLAAAEAAMSEPLVRPFDMSSRPMRGWVMVDQDGLDDAALQEWLDLARSYAETLPPK
jgi:TfoX/Sxy family transcriptional regulator of competence genes